MSIQVPLTISCGSHSVQHPEANLGTYIPQPGKSGLVSDHGRADCDADPWPVGSQASKVILGLCGSRWISISLRRVDSATLLCGWQIDDDAANAVLASGDEEPDGIFRSLLNTCDLNELRILARFLEPVFRDVDDVDIRMLQSTRQTNDDEVIAKMQKILSVGGSEDEPCAGEQYVPRALQHDVAPLDLARH